MVSPSGMAALISPPARVGLDVVLAWCMGGAGGKVTRGRPHTLLDPPTGERCLRRGRRRAPGQPRSFSAFGRTRRSPPCLVHGRDVAPPLAPELGVLESNRCHHAVDHRLSRLPRTRHREQVRSSPTFRRPMTTVWLKTKKTSQNRVTVTFVTTSDVTGQKRWNSFPRRGACCARREESPSRYRRSTAAGPMRSWQAFPSLDYTPAGRLPKGWPGGV